MENMREILKDYKKSGIRIVTDKYYKQILSTNFRGGNLQTNFFATNFHGQKFVDKTDF